MSPDHASPEVLCRAHEVVLDPDQFGALIYTLQGFTLAGVALAAAMLILGFAIYLANR